MEAAVSALEIPAPHLVRHLAQARANDLDLSSGQCRIHALWPLGHGTVGWVVARVAGS